MSKQPSPSNPKREPTSIRFSAEDKALIRDAMAIEGEIEFGPFVKRLAIMQAKMIQGQNPSSRHPVAVRVISGLNRIVAELRSQSPGLRHEPANDNSPNFLSTEAIRTLEEAKLLCINILDQFTKGEGYPPVATR